MDRTEPKDCGDFQPTSRGDGKKCPHCEMGYTWFDYWEATNHLQDMYWCEYCERHFPINVIKDIATTSLEDLFNAETKK